VAVKLLPTDKARRRHNRAVINGIEWLGTGDHRRMPAGLTA
jgi:hypothetical protein